jgi:hypothetical protein
MALSELESYADRFALLHHVVKRESDLVPVPRESIDAGRGPQSMVCGRDTADLGEPARLDRGAARRAIGGVHSETWWAVQGA